MNPNNIKKWDIVNARINPADRDKHPLVVVSPQPVIDNAMLVNVLFGSTKRPAVGLPPGRVLLDEADGLERMTVVNCAFVHSAKPEDLSEVVGSVSRTRREEIRRVLSQTFAP